MKVNRLLALFLAIGLVFSSILVLKRGNIENEYKNVEITVDYDELLKMGVQDSKSVDYFLKEFKNMNVISSVSLNEVTLNSLKDREDIRIKTYLDGYDLVVEADDNIVDFVLNGFKRKIDNKKIEIVDKNTFIIKASKKDYIYDETNAKDINGKSIGKRKIGEGSKYEFLGLGFLQSDIDKIKKAGLDINLRPIYVKGYDNKNSAKYYFNLLDEQNLKPNYIIFAGGEALAWDKDLNYVKNELEKRNMAVGMIENSVQREHIVQKGLEKLVENMDYKATRVFNIWDWVQERYDYDMPMHHQGQEIVNSMYRAVTERNIRIIYFKPFYDKNKSEYVTDMSIYEKRLKEFEKRINSGHDLKIGKLNTMTPYHPNKFMQIPIAIGIIASALILLDNMFKVRMRYIYALMICGLLGSALVFGIGIKSEFMAKMFALLASITMPTLSMVFVFNSIREILKTRPNINLFNIIVRSIVILFIASIISFMGVLFEVSMLFDIRFLLELDIFKGVKLSQMAPIALTLVLYIYHFGYKRNEDKTGFYLSEGKTLLNENIKIWQILAVSIIALAGIVFIARTGHESNIKPSIFELLFRNMLELILTARPRTKAFLFAHPAMILMVYCAFKNYRWAILPLSLAAVIGQGNIVNTFSHIRSPLYLSYIRTNYEMFFGIIVGVAVVLIVNFIFSRFERRKNNA